MEVRLLMGMFMGGVGEQLVEEQEFIWMNGEFVPWKDAKVHVLTHALHYGSGVFEGIRVYSTGKGPLVYRYQEHMERLYKSARMQFMDIPYTLDELMEAGLELIRKCGLDECYIRPIAYRGYGPMGVNPLNNPVHVAIAVWPWGAYLGPEALEKGIPVKISSFQRYNSNNMPTNAKATGQYLNGILAKVDALKSGVHEAIMLDSNGYVSEGTGENIFVMKGGVINTPPTSSSILEGITRHTAITLAKDKGYEVIERNIHRGDLYDADEIFFTGSAAEVTPIREVDFHEIPAPGPVTKDIQTTYFQVIRGEIEKYEKWYTYVN